MEGQASPQMIQTLQEREVELELDSRCYGVARYKKIIARAEREGYVSEGTNYGLQWLKATIGPLSSRIATYLANHPEDGSYSPGTKLLAGRIPVTVHYLRTMNPDTAAYLCAKSVIDSIATQNMSLVSLGFKVGRACMDEARFRFLKGESPEQFKKMMTHLAYRKRGEQVSRGVLNETMTRNDISFDEWPKADRLRIGTKLIELFGEASGLIRVELIRTSAKHSSWQVNLTEKAREWVRTKHFHCEALHPDYLPMLVKPRPWTTPYDGGYLSEHIPQLPLMKKATREHLETIAKANPQVVYDAINGLQDTAWAVNYRVYNVLQAMWSGGSDAAGLPSQSDPDLPPKPHDIDTNPEACKAWCKAVSLIKHYWREQTSKRIQVTRTLSIAKRFLNESEFYFPYQIDFRGRTYAVPNFLNPQSVDYAKGLLQFANGKPLGSSGARWLAIHGANTYGFDKASLDDRQEWCRENSKDIVRSASDPESTDYWRSADKPFQFLAFCFEWADYLTLEGEGRGEEYESKLPIALDGSSNGLQHFSALLRDSVGGLATNLCPAKVPQDIYEKVAQVAKAKLQKDESYLAKEILAFGITRKTTKKPVMTMPYGSGFFGFRESLREHFKERGQSGESLKVFSDQDSGWHAAGLLAQVIQDSISEVVVAAVQAMSYLKECARILTNHKLPITWTTPAGLPVRQSYFNFNYRRVQTIIHGSVVKFKVPEDTDRLSGREQKQGISPNLIHSLDAAAMMFTIATGKDMGIDAYAMVHDSYACHAADTDLLAMLLRQSFVTLYAGNLLAEIAKGWQRQLPAGVELPATPAMGDLDINLVLQSDYFFA